MYNEERKRQYLKIKTETSILSNNLYNAFEDSAKFEEEYQKDICEWTSNEIIGFYKYLGTSYIQTLVQLHNALNSYATWCMLNGLIRDNQNHFAEITTDMLCKCVDVKSLKGLFFTREDILSDIKYLGNFCDQFIILGLYEGIPVKDDIMKNVKLSDLDGNTLHLCNGNDLEISDQLKRIMRMASQEDTWISYSDKKKKIVDYIDDGCIIRFTKKKNDEPYKLHQSTIIIGARLRRVCKYLGWPENLTLKMIMESGRIHMMYELADKYNVPVIETITNPKIREMHEKIYGKIQNHTAYLNTYGELLI